MRIRTALLAMCLIGIIATPAAAQLRRSYWGLAATATPVWKVPDYQKSALDADEVTLKGSDFMVGFVRGDTLRGDWGLSYFHRTFSADAFVRRGTTLTRVLSGVAMNGAEIRKFAPFGTIKERVQIGLDFGLGVGVMSGNVDVTEPGKAAQVVEAKELFRIGGKALPVVPIGRLELAGTLIVTPQLKVRATGGINFPGQQVFSIGAVYLFGAR